MRDSDQAQKMFGLDDIKDRDDISGQCVVHKCALLCRASRCPVQPCYCYTRAHNHLQILMENHQTFYWQRCSKVVPPMASACSCPDAPGFGSMSVLGLSHPPSTVSQRRLINKRLYWLCSPTSKTTLMFLYLT